MFGSISSSFGKIFGKLSSKSVLTEKDIIEATEEIRIALLGADVAPSVANKLVGDIKEDLIGKSLPKNLDPADAIAAIVQKRLMALLGNEFKGIKLGSSFEIILLVGPYGSGKTTTAVKLAKHLEKKHQAKVCVASADVHRPAAAKQLESFARTNGITCIQYKQNISSKELVENAILNAKKESYNVVIIDTPGVESEEGYEEINQIHKASHANASIIVLDSMIGRQSINIAQKFNKIIPCTGVILTKTEGDTRGGVAINVRHETNLQIQYLGTGEDGNALEEFHPERIASRLLDRGDIESIVEKAYEEMGEGKLNSMKDRVVAGKMTFDDYLVQIRSMKNMGGISKVLSFLPGASQMGDISQMAKNIDFSKQEAIILSMTKKERLNPDLLEKSGSRRVRISKGSGTTLADVKKLLNQIQKMKDMAKVMSKMESNGISFDDIKNFDVNKLRNLLKN
jgi:signal recognition particle subunit SRP54